MDNELQKQNISILVILFILFSNSIHLFRCKTNAGSALFTVSKDMLAHMMLEIRTFTLEG